MIFGSFCVVMGIHVFLMWPETCQKSLEEIEILFDGGVPAWRSSQVKSRFDEEVQEIQRRRTQKGQEILQHPDAVRGTEKGNEIQEHTDHPLGREETLT
jgi:hypothetical protein